MAALVTVLKAVGVSFSLFYLFNVRIYPQEHISKRHYRLCMAGKDGVLLGLEYCFHPKGKAWGGGSASSYDSL